MRKRLFEIIEVAHPDDKVSLRYDYVMLATIILSLIPLTVKSPTHGLKILEYVTTAIFVADYSFRCATADFKLHKDQASFIIYPFTFLALVDLFSILPTLLGLSESLKLLKVFRLFRTMRVFRTLKLTRYSRSIMIISNVMRKQKQALLAVGRLAVGYILISALVVFNVEPDTFRDFFEAVYWATISLTTMGYGDIYPISTAGRIVTMISSFIGIAIVALPAGIITAGYMDEVQNR